MAGLFSEKKESIEDSTQGMSQSPLMAGLFSETVMDMLRELDRQASQSPLMAGLFSEFELGSKKR